MELLDGKKLAQKILDELKQALTDFEIKPRLAVAVVGRDPVVEKFIGQKKKKAHEIGIDVRVYPFAETITTNELRKRIAEIVHEEKNTGVVVQLPLPGHINAQYILNAVPPEKDVDVLSARAIGNFVVGKSSIFPTVPAAIKTLFEEYGVEYQKKQVAILGAGKLVGKPVAWWLAREGVTFSLLNSKTKDPEFFLHNADIIISGIGKPRVLRKEMIAEGAILIDAGTSESEGKTVGDVDIESVSEKAAYVTPVPGGIGPLTVALLFKNVILLATRSRARRQKRRNA